MRQCRASALMVELVDTRDLKSLDHSGRTGSSPVLGTSFQQSVYGGFPRETLFLFQPFEEGFRILVITAGGSEHSSLGIRYDVERLCLGSVA